MGMSRWDVARDIRVGEERFKQLVLMGRYASGQREREPLPENKSDEA